MLDALRVDGPSRPEGGPGAAAHTVPAAGEPSDAELVALAKRDPAAFGALYARYLDPIHRYCYRRLGSREAAEDATSTVFTKALAALPRYRDASFRAWLFAIAHNVVTDRRRANRPTRPLEDAAEVADVDPTPEEAALAADAGRSLRAYLARLPNDQRRVIELRLAGLTGPEIGRVLGRPRASINTIQFRAVARLRTLMGVAAEPGEGRDAQR